MRAPDDALGEGRGGGGQRGLIDEVVEGKKPASGHPLLLGITKASLSTDSSFFAAGSILALQPRQAAPQDPGYLGWPSFSARLAVAEAD